MIIYKLTNKINNKIYIGLTTTSLSKRLATHKSNAKRKNKTYQAITKAIIKYGIDNFTTEIIDTATSKEDLSKLEIYYISLFNSTNRNIGYNLSKGGELRSDEVQEKVASKLRGRKHSKEWNKKIAKSLTGIKHTEERKKNISKGHLGLKTWNKGTKGLMKPNSGSFTKGKPSVNKGRKRVLIDGKIKFISPEVS